MNVQPYGTQKVYTVRARPCHFARVVLAGDENDVLKRILKALPGPLFKKDNT